MPRRVLVTGADGQLAHYIVRAFAGSEVVALDRRALDITDPDAVARVVADAGAGRHRQLRGLQRRGRRRGPAASRRWRVNAFAVRSLALAAEQAGATLVHYSTDFVFDGTRTSEPYTEDRRAVAAEHLRVVEADGRVVRARRAARVRAARREPVRVAGRLDGPPRHARHHRRRPREPAARCRSSPTAWCRPATRRTSRRPRGTWSTTGRRAGPLSLRQRRPGHVGAGGARGGAPARRRADAAASRRRTRWSLQGRPAHLLRPVAAQARGGGLHDAGVAGRARPLAAARIRPRTARLELRTVHG